jgi:septal ring factor EnvC (AmiA/AmiB activator)
MSADTCRLCGLAQDARARLSNATRELAATEQQIGELNTRRDQLRVEVTKAEQDFRLKFLQAITHDPNAELDP